MEQFFQQSRVIVTPHQKRMLHAAEYETFLLVENGRGRCQWNGQSSNFSTETVLLLRPQTEVEVLAEGKTSVQICEIKLLPQFLQTLSDESCDLLAALSVVPFECAAVSLTAQDATMLKRLAGLMEQEQTSPHGFAAELCKKNLIGLFVVLLLRACRKEEQKNALVGRRKLMVDDVFAYINEHLPEPLHLKDLAAHFYVSQEHLAREFHRQTGQTVHQYIVKVRLAKCKELLCDGLPLTAIWAKCGFSSYTTMIRSFKQQFGISPTQYYKQCCQKAREHAGAVLEHTQRQTQ